MKRLSAFLIVASIAILMSFASSASVVGDRHATRNTGNIEGQISLHTQGRGNPWINLSDGRELPASYAGMAGLGQALKHGLVQPLALTSGDFDEDGVPDLIAGYAGSGGGIVALYRGNVDAIYPYSPEAQQRKAKGEFTDAPFLTPALVFEVPEAPTFLGAGDFDADGHWDVITAAREGEALHLLKGDGRGDLSIVQRRKLPGAVTALVSGEINRRDGLADVIVGVVGKAGPQALVFESPRGAWQGEPEIITLPAPARSLALGWLDAEYPVDLAIAAESELVIVRGRDRRLSLSREMQAQAPPVTVDQFSFPFSITSLAIGDFIWERTHQVEIALLADDGSVHVLKQEARGKRQEARFEMQWQREQLSSVRYPQSTSLVRARVSSVPTDSLVMIDPANHQLHVLMGDARALKETRPMMHLPTPEQARVPVSLDVVSQPVAVLPMRLNALALNSLVILESGSGVPSVVLAAPLATFTVDSTADTSDFSAGDGVCDTDDSVGDGPCTLRAAIEEANALAGTDTINFSIGGGGATATIAPATPFPTITEAVTIDGTTQGCGSPPCIELNGSGAGVTGNGLTISAGSSTVRGLVINRFGTVALGFRTGIVMDTSGSNIVEGNYVGTNLAGSAAGPGNTGDGVFANSVPNNTIGGTTTAARNVVSSNTSVGIEFDSVGATGNMAQGNIVGLNLAGTTDLGNGSHGVLTSGANNNTVGGTTMGAGNVISGNNQRGIRIGTGVTGTVVQGNLIGTTSSGTSGVGNSIHGVEIFGPSNTIGGTTTAARNVISGNTMNGILITGSGADSNTVQGNYIGVDSTGASGLANTSDGVVMATGADTNAIGGSTTAPGVPPGNIISSNGGSGVRISSSTSNTVEGNIIGGSGLGNTSNGVFIQNTANNNTIGGTGVTAGSCDGPCNEISSNGADGVSIASGTGNSVLGNSISANTDLGIDLGGTGVTANDMDDPDIGANNLQNFPVISQAQIPTSGATMGDLVIEYSVDSSTANSTYPLRVEFFEASSGQGVTFLGSSTWTATDLANGGLVINLGNAASLGVTAGDDIVATATDSATGGNTSEFSAAFTTTGGATAAEIASFGARSTTKGIVQLHWQTVNEVDVVGFNLLRGQQTDGSYTGVNGRLILARSSGTLTGASYQFVDRGVRSGQTYYYQLELIRPGGGRELVGPVRVTVNPVPSSRRGG